MRQIRAHIVLAPGRPTHDPNAWPAALTPTCTPIGPPDADRTTVISIVPNRIGRSARDRPGGTSFVSKLEVLAATSASATADAAAPPPALCLIFVDDEQMDADGNPRQATDASDAAQVCRLPQRD